ncbi:MAG: hypothetical protein JSS99_03990 [Actinobacteria bacterium]|nr:hypothetical protein [Actinomycetota bacterium]
MGEGLTVTLSGELATRARVEVERAGGDGLAGLVEQALRAELEQRELLRAVSADGGSPGDPPAVRLGRAIAATGMSTGAVEAVAATLLDAIGLVPGFREPGSVHEHVARVVRWVAAAPDRGVGCVIATSQPASGPDGAQRDAVVSYARGLLLPTPAGLSGVLDQLFSDRTAGLPAAPFAWERRDQLGVNVALDAAAGLVTVELVARSWGGARQRLANLRLEGGVLVGDGAGVGNATPLALHLLSFSTVTIPE